MPKQKSRTLKKGERDMIAFQSIRVMREHLMQMDQRVEAIADDIGLLVALSVATEDQRNLLLEKIKESSDENETETESTEAN